MISGSHSVHGRREDNVEERVQKEQMTSTRHIHVRTSLLRFSHTPHLSIEGIKNTSTRRTLVQAYYEFLLKQQDYFHKHPTKGLSFIKTGTTLPQ